MSEETHIDVSIYLSTPNKVSRMRVEVQRCVRVYVCDYAFSFVRVCVCVSSIVCVHVLLGVDK